MEKWNCKQRAFQWATNSSLIYTLMVGYTSGLAYSERKKIAKAVANLMREAHQHGFEKGYREGVKVGKKISMDVIIHDYQQGSKGKESDSHE